MVPLYTLALAGLAFLHRLLTRRAATTERRYARAALAAEQLAKASQVRPGNGSSPDTFAAAKRQYELGRLVDVRDKLEAKFVGWQARADAVASALARLRSWNGRAVPYLLGVADAGLMLAAAHYLGLPHGLTADTVKEWAAALPR